ncbi:MAG: sulfite exporter TauE/SafE family protein [Acidimicrobiales bacterium]
MHVDLPLASAAAVVGVLVGLTGTGGGALMTPMLVVFFGVPVPTAVACDLVASAAMRPVGAAVHLRRGTVDLPTVGWLTLGSVPCAVAGTAVLRAVGSARLGGTAVEVVLGAALLVGAATVVVRGRLQRRRTGGLIGPGAPVSPAVRVHPLPALAVGAVGGFLVGLTSVGAGSLMIVLLVCCAPGIAASQLVGTDLVQAVPLTCAAALGQLVFGHVVGSVTLDLVIGGVPGALVGAALSARVPEYLLRPALVAVMALSGLRCVGVGAVGIGSVAAIGVVVGGGLVWARRRRSAVTAGGPPSLDLSPKGAGTPSRSGAWG